MSLAFGPLPRDLPLPPFALATRVGSLEGTPDPWGLYEAIGRSSGDDLLAALPPGFSLDGRRVLDFGCGAGRTLRHFVAGGCPAELWGCDIDVASVDWLRQALGPEVNVFLNEELPPLAQPAEKFDLVYCVSVFTHLSRSWSSWLLELHRVLRPGGLLLATFMGEGEFEDLAGTEWDEGRVGMLTLHPGKPWSEGGPMVLHSPWWIREHWGRLFEILSLTPYGFAGRPPGAGHGLVAMRKRDLRLTPVELETLGEDPREATAIAYAAEVAMHEVEAMRRSG